MSGDQVPIKMSFAVCVEHASVYDYHHLAFEPELRCESQRDRYTHSRHTVYHLKGTGQCRN